MRRVGWVTALVVMFLAVPSPIAVAAPLPIRCQVTDPRLAELSGLASDGDNLYAVGDGGTDLEVFVLAGNCSVRQVIQAPVDPFDVEDLARTPDGTLWLADIGDNRRQRSTIALHALAPSGHATLYRLSYPDGAHDAEALLLDQHGVPYVITKEIIGIAGVYRPAGSLATPGPTVLQRVGSVHLTSTNTPGGPIPPSAGSVVITGAASSADGRTIALRSYTDAYLYSAPDGDVAAALARKPRHIPLPDEPQGEAIALEPDGTLLSGSEGADQPVRQLRHAIAVTKQTGPPTTSAPAQSAQRTASDGQLSDTEGMIIAGLVAALVVFIGGKLRRK